jgi:hypothetical protein
LRHGAQDLIRRGIVGESGSEPKHERLDVISVETREHLDAVHDKRSGHGRGAVYPREAQLGPVLAVAPVNVVQLRLYDIPTRRKPTATAPERGVFSCVAWVGDRERLR